MIAHGLLSGIDAVIMPVRDCPACGGCWPAVGSDATGWRCRGCLALALPDVEGAARELRLITRTAPDSSTTGSR